MCGKCDEAYYRFIHREDHKGTFVPMLAMFAAAIVPPIITTALLPITIAVVFLGFPAVLWYRSTRDRRTFLAMMRTRGALPEPAPKLTADEEALMKYEAKLADRKALEFQSTFDVSESNNKPDAPP
jgi:hypothetical protein